MREHLTKKKKKKIYKKKEKEHTINLISQIDFKTLIYRQNQDFGELPKEFRINFNL